MAEERRPLASAVLVTSSSTEMAAFELMKHLAQWENLSEGQKDRKYWLTLYAQCLRAVQGDNPKRILTEE
jgi:cytochrome c-type biogenesis protein CcmH/NrfG